MEFKENIPIYLQIMEEFKKKMVTGVYQPGDKIPSVRDLAVDYGVNPNTVQRALSALEQEYLLRSERTSGRFITSNEDKIIMLKKKMAEAKIDLFIKEWRELGLDESEMITAISGRIHHGNNSKDESFK